MAPDPDAVRTLAATVAERDGVAAFSEQTLLNLTNPAQGEQERPEGAADRAPRAFLLPVVEVPLVEGGELVGYAQIDRGSAELAVHPDHRRRGLGTRLLDEVLAGAPDARVWAHGPHAGAAPLAASRGLVVVRELWLMVGGAESLAAAAGSPPAVPDGVIVTTFDADRDGDDWVAVNARAFAHHPEQGRMTRSDLDARTAEPWFDPEGFWLARDATDGTLLASMWTKVSDAVGEIYVLGVDPAAQGRGLGGFLTATAMQRFARLGLAEVELYVEGDNEPAIRTYQRAGFRRRRADVQYAAG